MGVYFDSNAASHGSGSSVSPKKYIDNYVITDTDPIIYLKYGSVFNVAEWSAGQGFTSNVTNQKIVIQPYGDSSLPKPFVYSLRAATAHTGWIECNATEAVVNHKLVRQSGSNIWNKAGMSNSWLFNPTDATRQWGHWKDTYGLAIYGNDYPNAAYELSDVNITSRDTSDSSLNSIPIGVGTLVYSVGADPIAAYGSAGENGMHLSHSVNPLISIVDPLGGFEIYDIDFGASNQYSMSVRRSSTYNKLSPSLIVDGCSSTSSLGLLRLTFAHTGRTKNIGYAKVRIQNNYCERTGNCWFAIFGDVPYVSSMVMNDTIISHNVINKVCQRFSLGGLYLKECHTTDGSTILITLNSTSGSEAGHIWIYDGYSYYADFSAQNYKFFKNYCWNNGGGTRFNGTVGRGQAVGNVIISGPITDPTLSAMGSNDPNDVDLPANMEYAYNIAKGYKTFLGIQDIVAGSVFKIHHNISIGSGAGGHGIDCWGPTGITSNYNNFSQGHTSHMRDTYGAVDGAAGDLSNSAYVTNKLTSNPTSALSKIILTPDDPTFNYALTLPKMDDWTTTPAYESAPRLTKA